MQAKKDDTQEEEFTIATPTAPEKEEMPTKAEFSFRPVFYSIIKIDIGPGFKIMRESFNSSWKDEESALTVLKMPMPLGMVIDDV